MARESQGSKSCALKTAAAGRTIAIFGLAGAFTPTSSAKHWPGYVAHAAALKAKGVDEIWCLSVNDAFVMGAWGGEQKPAGKVRMLGDGSGLFATAMGVELDLISRGMDVPMQRFSMLVKKRQGHTVQYGSCRQIRSERRGEDVAASVGTGLSGEGRSPHPSPLPAGERGQNQCYRSVAARRRVFTPSPLRLSLIHKFFWSDGTFSSLSDQIGTFKQSGREGEASELIERGIGLVGSGFWRL